MPAKLSDLKKDLQKAADPKQAENLQRFFKTGKGEYGEGDIFLGIKMGQVRQTVNKYKDLPQADIIKLIDSKIHEHRMTGLLILVEQFQTAKNNPQVQKQIYNLYLKKAKQVNNWDLVDLTAPKISGPYLLDKDRKILYKLAKSKNLWEKRIAILSTFAFIRENDFIDAIKLATMLLKDKHDLIHKAVGWMLREIGKRDQAVEEKFLDRHAKNMPRTMLRYAIEKFPEPKRQHYLNI